MKETSTYKCPVCQQPLVWAEGDSHNSKEGITMWCEFRDCAAQEVFGYARNGKQDYAYEIIKQKYTPRERD